MSDDLISRKAVLNILAEERVRSSILASPAFMEMLAQRIKKLPTTFDKEKVIEQLNEAADWHGVYDGEYSIELNNAIEIVEKGGVE